jgi:formylglycine-generating enzyme required for sulfatase activity
LLLASFVVWYLFLQRRDLVIPAGWEAAPGARLVALRHDSLRGRLLGSDFPDRLRKTVADGPTVALVLVQGEGAPFYLAPRLVSNRLFLRFAEANPALVRPGWKAGGELARKAHEAPDLPVTNVSWDEAAACARWLGGELPTADQLRRGFRQCDDIGVSKGEELTQPNRRPDYGGGFNDVYFRIALAPRAPR